MANTTNYNWETPDDTDLVKDGAAAIRTLGSSIDTTTKALNPSTTLGDIEYRSATANTNARLAIGTTGQILSVVAGVPAWVANDVGDITEVAAGTGISGGGTSGSVTITNSMATAIDAKGDLIGGTGADTFARLAVGANNTVLTADSTAATGLKWAAPAGGGKILQVVSTNDNTKKQVTNATEYTEIATAITPSSASSRILIMVSFGLVSNSTNADSAFRIKRDSTAIQQGTGGTVNINQSFFMAEGSSEGSGYTIQVVDSPATTSAITYKVELLANTGTININRRGLDTYYAASSSMTLMEIGA